MRHRSARDSPVWASVAAPLTPARFLPYFPGNETAPQPIKAFFFDLDQTLVDSNDLHVESWDRAFRHFGKSFSHAELRAQIGKGSDKYLPEFLSPAEIEEFGATSTNTAPPFSKRNTSRASTVPGSARPLPAHPSRWPPDRPRTSGKKTEAKHYIDLLGIGDLIAGQTTADDADESKPRARSHLRRRIS